MNTFDKPSPGRFWILADYWFRFIEFSVISSALYYFGEKTNSLSLKIICILSFSILITWLIEFADYIRDKLISLIKYRDFSRRERMLIWILIYIIFIILFRLIFQSALIISGK